MHPADFIRPTYICARAEPDAQWVCLHGNAGGPVAFETRARLFWDEESLSCEFECEDDAHCCTLTGYNDELYKEDVVELFIGDDFGGKAYVEIEVSPIGALLHYYVRNNLDGNYWGYARLGQIVYPRITSLAGEGRPWRVKFSLPLSEFKNPPRPGDEFLFNLYRIKRLKDGPQYSAFSPTGADDFHRPERFGVLRFE